MYQRVTDNEEYGLLRRDSLVLLGDTMSLGPPELIIVFGIVLLLFGAKKLPGLANSMGRSIREFRMAADESPNDESADKP